MSSAGLATRWGPDPQPRRPSQGPRLAEEEGRALGQDRATLAALGAWTVGGTLGGGHNHAVGGEGSLDRGSQCGGAVRVLEKPEEFPDGLNVQSDESRTVKDGSGVPGERTGRTESPFIEVGRATEET